MNVSWSTVSSNIDGAVKIDVWDNAEVSANADDGTKLDDTVKAREGIGIIISLIDVESTIC